MSKKKKNLFITKILNKKIITESKMALKIRSLNKYWLLITQVFLESIKSFAKYKSDLDLQSRYNK